MASGGMGLPSCTEFGKEKAWKERNQEFRYWDLRQTFNLSCSCLWNDSNITYFIFIWVIYLLDWGWLA